MSGDIPTDETNLDDLPLPVRARNCLRNLGLRTVGEVRRTADKEFLSCPNLGRTTLMHIREVTGSPVAAGEEYKTNIPALVEDIRSLLREILKEIENANRFR